jgi:translation initiation factor 1A
MLGQGRLEAYCMDGKTRQCHIRGKMRKKVWVGNGDIILVSLREYQDEKGDVILKYSADEARELKSIGELPDHVTISDVTVGPPEGAAGEGGFEFGDASDDDDSSDGDGGVDVDAI